MREVGERSVNAGSFAAALIVILVMALLAATEAGAEEQDAEKTATFEGRTVPVEEVWELAEACVVWPDDSMECFRTKEDREAAEEERSAGDGVEAMASSSCPVRLYSLSMYSGTELSLHTRWIWHNLGSSGFSNRTSSYRISGCSATFRSGSWGSGTTYPGITSAWTSSSTMSYGWDDRVSSVWIH